MRILNYPRERRVYLMKKLNKRSKKIMIVTGVAAVCCAGVLAAVMVQANAQPNEDAPAPVSSDTSSVQLILSSGLKYYRPRIKEQRSWFRCQYGSLCPRKG